MKANSELTKLVVLLSKNDIPFEIELYKWATDITNHKDYKDIIRMQVLTPTAEDAVVDAVNLDYQNDLIEIMDRKFTEDVVPYLTAEEAFEYFKDIYERANKEHE